MIKMLKEKISRILLNDKNIKRETFFWNAFSAVMNSFQTMLLLLIITRMGNINDSSIFVMAYAVGNLVLNIGKYGVRQYQVTDVQEKYCFKDYVTARYVSMIFMVVATAAYMLYNILCQDYTVEKSLVVFLICAMKGIEAFEDVFHGRMQQKGRLDVAGRILGIRLCVFIVGFALMYIFTENLLLTTVVNVLITLLLALVFNSCVWQEFQACEKKAQPGQSRRILYECLPLGACTCLNMYIANAPKYTIDAYVSDDVQTAFNVVFMPVFIIALLATFIFQPFLKKMGELWVAKETDRFVKSIIKLALMVVVIDVVITVVGSFIGGPILGAVYGIDLKEYNTQLIIFMISGGVIALQNLLIMAITTVRYQKYMLYGYVVIAAVMLLAGRPILVSMGLTALCLFFLGMLGALLLYCVFVVVAALVKNRK